MFLSLCSLCATSRDGSGMGSEDYFEDLMNTSILNFFIFFFEQCLLNEFVRLVSYDVSFFFSFRKSSIF